MDQTFEDLKDCMKWPLPSYTKTLAQSHKLNSSLTRHVSERFYQCRYASCQLHKQKTGCDSYYLLSRPLKNSSPKNKNSVIGYLLSWHMNIIRYLWNTKDKYLKNTLAVMFILWDWMEMGAVNLQNQIKKNNRIIKEVKKHELNVVLKQYDPWRQCYWFLSVHVKTRHLMRLEGTLLNVRTTWNVKCLKW